MADLASLLDSARLHLGDWVEVFTANLEYLSLSAVLVFPVFVTWLWLPLRRQFWSRRFWVRINCRRPNVQSYLPQEVDRYITSVVDSAKQSGKVASFIWAAITVALSLGVFQQGVVFARFIDRSLHGLFALVAGAVVWVATRWLWMRAPLCIKERIEGERKRWIDLREMGYDGWKGWAVWEFEDAKLLNQRKPALRAGDETTAWEMLKSPLEKSFWEILMERRVPHIYQLVIPTPEGPGDHRRLDFALLDPKTGEPVLGIETDEWRHFVDKDLQWNLKRHDFVGKNRCEKCNGHNGRCNFTKNAPDDDFKRELEIWNEVGIPIYRIPGAYWFRGLAPNDTKHPEKIKENQQRILDVALRERDRVIRDSIAKTKQRQIRKEKRKEAMLRWLTRLLRRQQ